MLGEQRDDPVVDPPALPELHGHAYVARNERKKVREGGQLGRSEVGSELHQNGAQLRAELARAIEEQRGEVRGVPQPVFVRDLLRQLEREREIGWRSIG